MKYCPKHENPFFGDSFNYCPFCGRELKVKSGEDYIKDMNKRLKSYGMKQGPNGEGTKKDKGKLKESSSGLLRRRK